MRCAQAAVHRDGLAVHIGCRIAEEKTGHLGDFRWLAVARSRIDLTDPKYRLVKTAPAYARRGFFVGQIKRA